MADIYINVSYEISYDANGGSSNPSATTGTKNNVLFGSTFTVTLTSSRPTRTGYTFLGWSASSSATSASYSAGGSYTITASSATFFAKLYAVWRRTTYTISYNKGANGTGTNATDTKTYGQALTLKGAIFTRTGYTQTGWSTTDGGAKAYNLSASYTNNAAVTLYPYWTANTYTVSYNKGANGTGTNISDTKTHGTALTLKGAIFTRTGYTQTGWSTSDGGSKTYNLSASYTNNASITLYPFWSAKLSTVSTSNSALGIAKTLTVTRYNTTTFTHTITYKYGEATGTIATKSSSDSISWTPAASLASEFPNASSGTCILTVKTYDGNALLGSTTKAITLSISSVPSATITITQKGNSTVTGWGIYVQGYSYAQFDVTGLGVYGSTVSSISITGEGLNKTANSASLTGSTSIFSTPGSKSYTITVTDSRGKSKSYTRSITVDAYSTPSLVGFDAYRSDSLGITDQAGGEYLTVKADQFSYSSCNGNNVVSVTYKFKVATITTWTTITSSAVQNTNYVRAAGTEANYDVQAEISDSLGNKQIIKGYVSSINIALTLGLLNDRARFGGVPRGPGLEVDWDVKFDRVVDIVSRRSYATLSNPGWYRVLTYALGSLSSGALIKFRIIQYGDRGAQSSNHEITLSLTTGGASFVDEKSNGSSTSVKKIRLTRSDDEPRNMYVDIYYDDYSEKSIDVYFDSYIYNPYQKRIMAEGFRLVAAAPSGETVVVTSDLSASVHATYLRYYDEESAADYTIGSSNYVGVQYPQSIQGKKIVSIAIISWTSNSGAFTILPYGDSAGTKWYIIGDSGTTINGARFRYWYV